MACSDADSERAGLYVGRHLYRCDTRERHTYVYGVGSSSLRNGLLTTAADWDTGGLFRLFFASFSTYGVFISAKKRLAKSWIAKDGDIFLEKSPPKGEV